jgi:hypothetical protein
MYITKNVFCISLEIHIIYERLEGSQGIGEAKRHQIVLKTAEFTTKGSFPLIILTYTHQVIHQGSQGKSGCRLLKCGR